MICIILASFLIILAKEVSCFQYLSKSSSTIISLNAKKSKVSENINFVTNKPSGFGVKSTNLDKNSIVTFF
jgi:hypothetical protein